MSFQTAEIVLYSIAAVELVVWVAAFEFLRHTTLSRRRRAVEMMDRFEVEDRPGGDLFGGEIEVKGEPAQLASKFASTIAKEGIGLFGPAKVLEVEDRRVAFESLGPLGNGAGAGAMRGEVAFRPGKSGLSEAAYVVRVPSSGGLLAAAWTVQTIGLIVFVSAVVLLRIFLVDHPNPGVRAQVFQMIQMVHLLWPPFLLAGLARTRTKAAVARVDAMINNLPYA